MKTIAFMLILFGLSACTGFPESAANSQPGWSCTPDGACWPSDFPLTKQYRYKWVADTDAVAEICLKTNSPHPYACILMKDTPHPVIVVPERFTPAQQACGWNVADTVRHEEGHGEGVTVHHKIRAEACNAGS